MARAGNSPGPRTGLGRRLVRAARLDAGVFEELENDATALPQAALVVALAGAARGLGAAAEEGFGGLLVNPVIGLVVWLVAGLLIWAIGVGRFEYTSSYRELLRTTGFAAAPLLVLALGVLPLGAAGSAVRVLAHAWAVAALVVAVREALDVSTGRSIFVCLLALALSLAVATLMSLLLVGSELAA